MIYAPALHRPAVRPRPSFVAPLGLFALAILLVVVPSAFADGDDGMATDRAPAARAISAVRSVDPSSPTINSNESNVCASTLSMDAPRNLAAL